MKMLMEDIKNKQFKKIYLLTGEEVYLRNQYRKRLRSALLDPEDTMNGASFEGKGIDPKEIIDLAETMPFFAERRVIELSDSGFAKNACPELADYVPEIPETTCIILNESEVDKRGRLYKAIKNSGRVVEFKRQDEKTLARWVLGILKKEDKNITEETMHVFLGRTGSDMENIVQELDKLLSYTLGRSVITTADVEAVCTEQTENRIFDMVQAITEKNQKKALDLYADLLAMKEPPMRILFLIARQFNQLLQLKSLSGSGLDRSELAKKAGIPPFALGKYQAQCRKFTIAELRRAVEDCVSVEEQVKTGQMADQISVELLIVKYSS
jgi:DNA polymerase-3 subunit delta